MTTFDIFGGCTSRDLFNFENSCGRVGNYFARSSLISQYSEKDPSLQNVEINLGSKFQREMVLGDLRKHFYNYFRNGSRVGTYLVIDLLIERLPLIKFQNGLITRTSEYAKIRSDLGVRKEILMSEREHVEAFRKIAPTLAEDLRKYKKVFLHKSFLRNQYVANDGKICNFDCQEKITATNAYLSVLYDILADSVKDIHILHVPKFFAWEGHRWGLTNYHFETDYYYEINQLIRDAL